MAKSIRAKAKMAARKKKRESGSYHAQDAARVARISAKLLGKQPKEDGDDEEMEGDDAEGAEGEDATMEAESKKISTSAPRESRREKWRESKGMAPRPNKKGTNRQGIVNGRRKAGKPKRRR